MPAPRALPGGGWVTAVDDRLRYDTALWIRVRLLHTLQWMVDDWPAIDTRRWGPGFVAALAGWLEPGAT